MGKRPDVRFAAGGGPPVSRAAIVRLAGFFGHVSLFDTVNRLMWLPMLVFEVVLAFRLITKGAPAPAKADLR